MLAIIPLVLTAYAEAPSHVDVYDYPFNITLLEGGNFTLYNNGTANINMVSHGWFDAIALAGGSVTVDLPADKFFAQTYYVQDVMNDSMSTITIESPTPVYVAPPVYVSPPTPVYVPPTPEPIEESIYGEPTPPEVTGIHTWCNSPCSDDTPIVQFNNNSETNNVLVVSSSSTSVVTNNSSSTSVITNNMISDLKTEIESLKVERDEWKNLANSLMKIINFINLTL